MNKKEISLYLDGLSNGVETLFLRHLQAINRLSRYEESGVASWQTTNNADSADMFFLGEDHHFDNPLQLKRPILFDGIVPTALKSVAVRVKFPMTSNALRELMQNTIENFQPAPPEEDSRKITIHLPERKVKSVAETEQPNTEKMVEPATKVVEKKVEKPTPPVSGKSAKTKQANRSDTPFFEGYLKTYQPKEQTHTVVFADKKTVYINRLQGKIFADCENIRDLVHILARDETPQISAFGEQPTELRAYPFDAVLWSYGLHAPVPDDIAKKFDIAGQKARLKRWPLFGKWETESKLLFLTTLFTQKFVSLREAEVKSEQDKDFVLHFMAAAELAGLPFEIEQSNDQEEPPIQEKKKVGWINSLRKKLNMNNILSGNG